MRLVPNGPPSALVDFIPWLSPQFHAPYHLNPLPGLLDAAPRGGLRVLADPPVRHVKTTTCLHAIAKWLTVDPTLEIFYLTYAARFSERNSREARRLTVAAGVELSKVHNTIAEWRTEAGGTVYAASTDQEHQGRGADIVIVDDGLAWIDRDNADARDRVDEAIAYATTRLNPKGSVFVIGSRSHPDDPIGRRLGGRAKNWTHVAMPAIIDEGQPTERALWPEVRDLDHLKEIRAELTERGDQRVWDAQYQGRPRSSLDELFKEPLRYSMLPDWPGFRYVMGVDLAYSVGKDSDWFALVTLKVWGSAAYVIETDRMHADLPALESRIRSSWVKYGRCPIFSYVAGPEWGAVRYFAERGIQMSGMNARYNKKTRAQKTIDRWNAGKILLPDRAPWLDGFKSRVAGFTGAENDRDDDEVDALVSACDGGVFGSAVSGGAMALGGRRGHVGG